MKRVFLFVIFFTYILMLLGQNSIIVNKEGGIFKIPCLINGAKMKIAYIENQNEATISLIMANYLYENKFILKDDIEGGEISNNAKIKIKDISIGNTHFYNSVFIVKDDQQSLTCGQLFLERIGNIKIDGEALRFEVRSESLQKKYDEKISTARKFVKNEEYIKAIDLFESLVKEYPDSTINILKIAVIYSDYIEDDKKAIENLLRWRSTCVNPDFKLKVRSTLSIGVCYYNLKEYSKAIQYLNEFLESIQGQEKFDNDKVTALGQIALSYQNLRQYSRAFSFYKMTSDLYMNINNLSIKQIDKSAIDDSYLGSLFSSWGFVTSELGNIKDAIHLWTLAANCGNQTCIDYCKKNKIKYKTPKL